MKKRRLKVIGLLILIFIISEAYIFSTDYFNKAKKSDVIIVLGCAVNGDNPSTFLYERSKRAAELYKEGYGKTIILSGGKGNNENISEAEAMRRIMIEEGIREDALILEEMSTNTYENIANSKKIMDDRGFKDSVIVSNKFHLRRAKILSDGLGIRASYSGIFLANKNYWFKEVYGGIREIPAIIKDFIKVYL